MSRDYRFSVDDDERDDEEFDFPEYLTAEDRLTWIAGAVARHYERSLQEYLAAQRGEGEDGGDLDANGDAEVNAEADLGEAGDGGTVTPGTSDALSSFNASAFWSGSFGMDSNF